MDMDKRFLIVLTALALTVSGCDWVRSRLDMPTSQDIAKKKELIAQKEASDKARLAASDTSVQKKLASEGEVAETEAPAAGKAAVNGLNLTPQSSLDKTYYIIVGAFKTDELVSKSLKDNAGILEAPFAFYGGGLKYVAIGGYETLDEARKALVKAHQKAPDAWVYKKK